jgi:hypothetical protein
LKIINILIVYPQLDTKQKTGVGVRWMMFIIKSLIDYIRNHSSFNSTKRVEYAHVLKSNLRNSNFNIYIYNKNGSVKKKTVAKKKMKQNDIRTSNMTQLFFFSLHLIEQ